MAVAVVAVIAITQNTDHTRQNAAASSSATSSTPAPSSSTRPSSSATKSSSRPRSSGPSLSLGESTPPSGAKLPLVVLNNTQQSGLAAQAADQFRNGGWQVTDTGNLVNDILSTCAYYDPSVSGAKEAAELLQQQFPAIQRVAEKFAELPSGPIVVVLTGDYQVG